MIQPFGPEERELLRKSYRHNSDVLDLLGLLEEAEADRDQLKAKLRRIILMAHQEGHGALASIILALETEESEAERDKFKRELAKFRFDDTYRAARLGALDQ